MKCWDCHMFKGKFPVVNCGGKVQSICGLCANKWMPYMPSLGGGVE